MVVKMALEVFATAQKIFRESSAIRDFFKSLPHGTEIAVRLVDRIDCTLRLTDNEPQLDEGAPANADIEITLGNEILRKWADQPPDEISDLALTLLREGALGQVRIKMLRPSKELLDKGYLKSMKTLGPKVQAELMQKGLVLFGQAQGMFQMAKSVLQESLKETIKKK
jgi:hypothetical protein